MARNRRDAAAVATFVVLGLLPPAHAQDFDSEVRPILERRLRRLPRADEAGEPAAARRARPGAAGGMSGEVIVPGRAARACSSSTCAASRPAADAVREAARSTRRRSPASRPGSTPGPGGPEEPAPEAQADALGVREASPAGAFPRCAKPAWVKNPIDAFVLARLEREGSRPSPEAARETLAAAPEPRPRRAAADARRKSTPSWTTRAPAPTRRVVDRLLASPRYGERWARPWLDLARYADTQRLREGPAPHRLEVPRLGDRRAQPRPVVPRLHDRAARRATCSKDATRRAADRDRLPPQQPAQPGGRHRRRGAALRDARRPGGHHRQRLAGQHARVRPVPQPQVRPVPAEGLLPRDGVLRQRRSTASTARARRWSTAGSSSPSSSSRRKSRRSGGGAAARGRRAALRGRRAATSRRTSRHSQARSPGRRPPSLRSRPCAPRPRAGRRSQMLADGSLLASGQARGQGQLHRDGRALR